MISVPRAKASIDQLIAGNERFRAGRPSQTAYTAEALVEIAQEQRPIAAVIACSDSRSCPEIVFDQPLGALFASRVPGNVASDSAKWMLEIAVGEFHVPLLVVMGHTRCIAVGQLLDGDQGGAGGMHRFSVMNAVYRAKSQRPEDIYVRSIEENVRQTLEHLARDVNCFRAALYAKEMACVGAVYEMETGTVRWLDVDLDIYGRF